jgi:hypothetical protein
MTVEEFIDKKSKEKRDLKSLLPAIQKEIDAGKPKMRVFEEFHLNRSQVQAINYYLRRDEPIREENYLIIPEKIKEKEYVFVEGKRYLDITAEIVDCGG